MALLEVEHLKKYFPVHGGVTRKITGYYKAVDDVSFSIEAGQTFGLVGESGCGKTTVGKSILRLIEPTDGVVRLDGQDVTQMSPKQLREQRKNMQIIFQDPYSSLNPRMTVESLIAEPMFEHKLVSGKAEAREQVSQLLTKVGLNPKDMHKYPHEFSGGQRQRVMIARAISVCPKVVVCDEPVSALDVSVQAQILNLMQDLQDEMGISYLFIAHGMPVVQHISQRVGVMYLGHLVEVADSMELFLHHTHPYTKALLSAIPNPDPDQPNDFDFVKGEVPSLIDPPPGCLFSNRCPYCTQKCKEEMPQLRQIAPGHQVACHCV